MKLTKQIDLVIINGSAILNCPSCLESSHVENSQFIACPECGEKHEVITTLRDALKELRALRNFTNEEMAEFLDVSKDTLKNWISGRFMPSKENMVKIMAIFSIEGIVYP